MKFRELMKKPSAYLPPAMSLAALSVVAVHLALFGITRDGDEGTAAHIFQLLITGEVPIGAWFAIRWLPRSPRPGLVILVLQFAAVCAAFTPIYLLEL